MKLFEKISSGSKRIAKGIAIIGFLTILYIALIPVGTYAASGVYSMVSGTPIGSALVKLVDYPQYNTTTDSETGVYTMPGVPEGTYRISASKPGYFRNVSNVTVVGGGTAAKIFSLSEATDMSISWTATQGGWTTPFVIANKGVLTTGINISYYNAADGSYAGNYSMNLKPGASKFVFREWTTSTDGSAVIKSDDPISGVVYQIAGGLMGVYEVDPYGSKEYFLPWTDETNGWTTPFVIANQGDQTARVDITYYLVDGSEAGTYTDYINPGASKFVFRSWTTASAGATKLTSNQTISVVVDMFGPSGKFGSYTPSSFATNEVLVPWTTTTGGWSTPMKVVNRGTNTATVNVSYYDSIDGTLKGNDSVIISPNQVVDILRENSAAIGTDGSAVLNSTQPISVIVPEIAAGFYEVYTPSLVTTNTIVIPWLATTGGWTTPYVVVNKGKENAIVNISYYNAADGSFAGQYSINLLPSASKFVFREWTTVTDGSAVLVSNQPITAMVDAFSGSYFGAYTALG